MSSKVISVGDEVVIDGEVKYGQDMRFYRGSFSGEVFQVSAILPTGTRAELRAPGYGGNPYGDGSIFVDMKHLVLESEQRTLMEECADTPEKRCRIEEEYAISAATCAVADLMAKWKVSKEELAKRLGWTPYRVTCFLNGSRNLTLRQVARVMFFLGSHIVVGDRPLEPYTYREIVRDPKFSGYE